MAPNINYCAYTGCYPVQSVKAGVRRPYPGLNFKNVRICKTFPKKKKTGKSPNDVFESFVKKKTTVLWRSKAVLNTRSEFIDNRFA